jgi:hypothetical protein
VSEGEIAEQIQRNKSSVRDRNSMQKPSANWTMVLKAKKWNCDDELARPKDAAFGRGHGYPSSMGLARYQGEANQVDACQCRWRQEVGRVGADW